MTSCKVNKDKTILWKLDNKHISDLYIHLYDNKEHGGKFNLNTHTKSSHNAIRSNVGLLDSVDSPDAIVNWHSHPINCYKFFELLCAFTW